MLRYIYLAFSLSTIPTVALAQGAACNIPRATLSGALDDLRALTVNNFNGTQERRRDQTGNLLDEDIPLFGVSVNQLLKEGFFGEDRGVAGLFDLTGVADEGGDDFSCSEEELLELEKAFAEFYNKAGSLVVEDIGERAAGSMDSSRPVFSIGRPAPMVQLLGSILGANEEIELMSSSFVADIVVAQQFCGNSSSAGSSSGRPVTFNNIVTTETLVMNVCVEVIPSPEDTQLLPVGLFNDIEETIDFRSSSIVTVGSTIFISAEIRIPYGSRSSENYSRKLAANINLELEGSPESEVTLNAGLVELDGILVAKAAASLTIKLCGDNEENECEPGNTGPFSLERKLEYSLAGELEVVSPLLKGILPNDRLNFSVEDNDAFSKPGPNISLPDLEDFLFFSPNSAISLLRTIDSMLVRVEENEAFRGRKVPFTLLSFADIVQTGSILTKSIVPVFLQVQDIEKRPAKSISVISGPSKIKVKEEDLRNVEELEFFFVRGEKLKFNPNRSSQVNEAVNSDGARCTFGLDVQESSDPTQIADALRDGINGACPIVACSMDKCRETDLLSAVTSMAPERILSTNFVCDSECDIAIGVSDSRDAEGRLFVATTIASTPSKVTAAPTKRPTSSRLNLLLSMKPAALLFLPHLPYLLSASNQ